jgi:uncharacterized protein YjbJ (UPF0337 family)
MVHDDKLKNKIDEGAGKAKEAAGRVTGDEGMRQEGTGEKNAAQLKDKIQDAVDKAKDKAKDVFKK